MEPLKLKAQLVKSGRKADDSVTISFVTAEEIGTDLYTHIDEYRKQNGWLLFKADDFSDVDIPKENAGTNKQSPAQALRSTLYAKHLAMGGSKETFVPYYDRAMAGFKQAVIDSFPGS